MVESHQQNAFIAQLTSLKFYRPDAEVWLGVMYICLAVAALALPTTGWLLSADRSALWRLPPVDAGRLLGQTMCSLERPSGIDPFT